MIFMAQPQFQTDVVGSGSLSVLCPIPEADLVATALLSTDSCKQIVFCLAVGQEIADHQTPNVAVVHVLDGQMTVHVQQQAIELGSGDLVVIPSRVTHSVQAATPTRFMLTLVKESD